MLHSSGITIVPLGMSYPSIFVACKNRFSIVKSAKHELIVCWNWQKIAPNLSEKSTKKSWITSLTIIFSHPIANIMHEKSVEQRKKEQSMYGRLEDTPARAALDFSYPPKMRNIIEISKLRKNNEKSGYVGNYVIFLSWLWLFMNIWKNSYKF